MICPNVSRGDQCNNYDITSARNIFQSSSHSKIVSNTSQTHNKYLISLSIIIWNEKKRFSKHCPEEIKAAIVSVWTKVTCCRFLKKWHDWFRLYFLPSICNLWQFICGKQILLSCQTHCIIFWRSPRDMEFPIMWYRSLVKGAIRLPIIFSRLNVLLKGKK